MLKNIFKLSIILLVAGALTGCDWLFGGNPYFQELLGWNDTEDEGGEVITTPDFYVTFDYNDDGETDPLIVGVYKWNPVTKPDDPKRPFPATAGLYLGEVPANYVFDGWYHEDELFDFMLIIFEDITLTARYSMPKVGTLIETVPANDVTAAITYVNANAALGEYILLLDANAGIGEQTLGSANAKLTIRGIESNRTITVTGSSSFNIGQVNVSGISLVLENNITVNGNMLVNTAAYIKLSGNSAIAGELTLLGRTLRDNAYVEIDSDWSGSVTKLSLRGLSGAIREAGGVISFWENFEVLRGSGLDTAAVGRFTLGDFEDSLSRKESIIEAGYSIVNSGANIGRLEILGTENNPFLIFTEAQLRKVGTETGTGWTLSAHYKLENNITLTGGAWTPIGAGSTPFRGTFDGGGYTITGITINNPTTNNQGMFGYIEGGTVKNLGLINVSIAGNNSVGGLVGEIEGLDTIYIQNCFVTGSVTGNGFYEIGRAHV